MSDVPSRGELILYRTEDGRDTIQLRVVDRTVWLTQAEIAGLFDTTKQNVSLHLKNIFDEREFLRDSVVKKSLTTAADGEAATCKDSLQVRRSDEAILIARRHL
jgi:hypothetical protein